MRTDSCYKQMSVCPMKRVGSVWVSVIAADVTISVTLQACGVWLSGKYRFFVGLHHIVPHSDSSKCLLFSSKFYQMLADEAFTWYGTYVKTYWPCTLILTFIYECKWHLKVLCWDNEFMWNALCMRSHYLFTWIKYYSSYLANVRGKGVPVNVMKYAVVGL